MAIRLYGAKGGGNLFRSFRNVWMLEELGVPYDHIAAAPRSKEANEGNPGWGKIPGMCHFFNRLFFTADVEQPSAEQGFLP